MIEDLNRSRAPRQHANMVNAVAQQDNSNLSRKSKNKERQQRRKDKKADKEKAASNQKEKSTSQANVNNDTSTEGRKKNICFTTLDGKKCERNNCHFRHEATTEEKKLARQITKKKPCRDMVSSRACPRGDNCRFSHEQKTLDTARAAHALQLTEAEGEGCMLESENPPTIPPKRLLEARGLVFVEATPTLEVEDCSIEAVEVGEELLNCDETIPKEIQPSEREAREERKSREEFHKLGDKDECSDSRGENKIAEDASNVPAKPTRVLKKKATAQRSSSQSTTDTEPTLDAARPAIAPKMTPLSSYQLRVMEAERVAREERIRNLTRSPENSVDEFGDPFINIGPSIANFIRTLPPMKVPDSLEGAAFLDPARPVTHNEMMKEGEATCYFHPRRVAPPPRNWPHPCRNGCNHPHQHLHEWPGELDPYGELTQDSPSPSHPSHEAEEQHPSPSTPKSRS